MRKKLLFRVESPKKITMLSMPPECWNYLYKLLKKFHQLVSVTLTYSASTDEFSGILIFGSEDVLKLFVAFLWDIKEDVKSE